MSNENINTEKPHYIEWWNGLDSSFIYKLTGKYGFIGRRNRNSLTDEEVHKIYKLEHSD